MPPLRKLPDPDQPADFWIDLVTHPEKNRTNHINFDNASQYPFLPAAEGVSHVNAWWLAEASLLAYWRDPATVQAIYGRQTGLTCHVLSANSTQCHLAFNERFAIVAFRGTQPDEWQDIFDDARYGLVDWPTGRVHAGFRAALDRIWGTLSAELGGLPSGCRVWFTGHSLGAALATLAADRFPTTAGHTPLARP